MRITLTNFENIKILSFLVISFCIVGVLFILAHILSSKKISNELMSEYECGFEPFDDATRQPFDVHYYIVGILFLIFDVEIALIFPWVLNIKLYELLGFYSMLLFLIIITFGFFYEWHLGALQWPRYSMHNIKIATILFKPGVNKIDKTMFYAFLVMNPSYIPYNSVELLDILESNFKFLFYFSCIYYLEFFIISLILGSLLLIVYCKKNRHVNEVWYKYGLLHVKNSSFKNLLSDAPVHIVTINSDKVNEIVEDIRKNDFMVAVSEFYTIGFMCLGIPLISIILCPYWSNFTFSFINFVSQIPFFSVLPNFLNNDNFTMCCILLILFFIIIILELTNYNFNLIYKSNILEFYFFIANALFFFVILVKSLSLITIFICIIGFSISSYLIIMTNLTSVLSREAAIKYYYLSVLSSMLFALGILLVFVQFGTTNLLEIDKILYYYMEFNVRGFNFSLGGALLLILFGLLFKLNCFPCHWWSADIYNGLTYNVLSFLVLPVKFSIFIVLLKILFFGFSTVIFIWQPFIIFSAVGSILWGIFFSIYEFRVKKFIALSSINQFGFILIGLIDVSITGIKTSLFYLIIYLLTSLNLLVILASTFRENVKIKDNLLLQLRGEAQLCSSKHVFVSKKYFWNLTSDIIFNSYESRLNINKCLEFNFSHIEELTVLTDFKNFTKSNWHLGTHLSIIFFSMAGVPPMVGFFSKFYMLFFSMTAFELSLTFIGLLSSVLGAYYYLRFIQFILFEPLTTYSLRAPRFHIARGNNSVFISMLSTNLFFLIEFNAWILAYIVIIDLGLQRSTGVVSAVLNYMLNDFLDFFTFGFFF